jgi:YfiH family protein
MSDGTEFIHPDWPAPDNVQARVTTRKGGFSKGGFTGLNLAAHVGDVAEVVAQNRAELKASLGLPAEPCWLSQVHSSVVVQAADVVGDVQADAVVTDSPGMVCAVLTADCLPVLLTDTNGQLVAAVHAGWRGLCTGILENTVENFLAAGIDAQNILAWFGPAIGPQAYEVDEPVRNVFIARAPDCSAAFSESRSGHWFFDLYAAARISLAAMGVVQTFGGEFCTYNDERFYSYRREASCGRQASLIWL